MRALAAVSILTLVSVSFGQKVNVEKPASGTALRKAVLDGLRPTIEKDLGQKVVFVVKEIRVYKGFAYVAAQPVKKDLKPIDFSKTKYKERIDDGVFDGDTLYALLKVNKSKWTVKDFVIGPTDVYWSIWTEKPYNAPKEVLPPPFGPK